jgi:hypothetical protein
MISKYGYESNFQSRTFDTYNDVDCWNYSDVHDYIKLIKYGYGKVLDHACREIRLQHMSRIKGIELVNQYLLKEPKNLHEFTKWLGITENSFYYIIDQFRNLDFWERDSNYQWNFKNSTYLETINSILQDKIEDFEDFIITEKGKSTDSTKDYILVGKGTL